MGPQCARLGCQVPGPVEICSPPWPGPTSQRPLSWHLQMLQMPKPGSRGGPGLCPHRPPRRPPRPRIPGSASGGQVRTLLLGRWRVLAARRAPGAPTATPQFHFLGVVLAPLWLSPLSWCPALLNPLPVGAPGGQLWRRGAPGVLRGGCGRRLLCRGLGWRGSRGRLRARRVLVLG